MPRPQEQNLGRDSNKTGSPAFDGESVSVKLAEILQAAPFGIAIHRSDGDPVFINDIARSDPASANAHIYQIDDCGGVYTVGLCLDADEARRQQDLFRAAYFDDLTGLPNRAVLEQSVNALIQDGGEARFAIAFLDLDRFRDVNHHFGTAIGDALLAEVARRVGEEVISADLLARFEGNSFVLLLGGPNADVTRQLGAISRRISEPFVIDGQEIYTTASIGVSSYPEDAQTFSALTWNAERAMRSARLDDLGGVRFYDKSIEIGLAKRTNAEQRLRRAIRDLRISCAFQPKVDLATGEVRGVEALMRWRDDDGVVQEPGEMLAIATDLGLIDQVAHMVLDEIILSIDKINEAFSDECSISINVAARQAGNERFMRGFVDRLASTGFIDRFIIEVTEEAFLATTSFQRRILPMIRDSGARVSIDDFGTGYSSLGVLADITADEVKIDRSFVTDVHKRPRSQTVLRAIEALCHSLGMSIVVEGVETIEEVEYLRRETRIQMAQGYYFSRPIIFETVSRTAFVGSRIQSPTRHVTNNRR